MSRLSTIRRHKSPISQPQAPTDSPTIALTSRNSVHLEEPPAPVVVESSQEASSASAICATPLALAVVGGANQSALIENLAARRLQAAAQPSGEQQSTVKVTAISPGGSVVIDTVEEKQPEPISLLVSQKAGKTKAETQLVKQQTVIPGQKKQERQQQPSLVATSGQSEPSSANRPRPMKAILRNPLMSPPTTLQSTDNQQQISGSKQASLGGEPFSFTFNNLAKRSVGYDFSPKRNSDGKFASASSLQHLGAPSLVGRSKLRRVHLERTRWRLSTAY